MSVEERILKCVSLMDPSVVTEQQDSPILPWRAGLLGSVACLAGTLVSTT